MSWRKARFLRRSSGHRKIEEGERNKSEAGLNLRRALKKGWAGKREIEQLLQRKGNRTEEVKERRKNRGEKKACGRQVGIAFRKIPSQMGKAEGERERT